MLFFGISLLLIVQNGVGLEQKVEKVLIVELISVSYFEWIR